MFGLFSVQMAAVTNGPEQPPSTPEPGEATGAVRDDGCEGIPSSQYGPAAVARKSVKIGPYAEEEDKK